MGAALADLPVPGKYRWVPDRVPAGSPYNVAQLYVRLAECIRDRQTRQPWVRCGCHPSSPARRNRACLGDRGETDCAGLTLAWSVRP